MSVFHCSIVPIVTCPLVPLAASPCPSAIGFASGHCLVGLAGWRDCNGRRGEANELDFKYAISVPKRYEQENGLFFIKLNRLLAGMHSFYA